MEYYYSYYYWVDIGSEEMNWFKLEVFESIIFFLDKKCQVDFTEYEKNYHYLF